MKKLVIKTIFITVLAVLALCITVMSAFCVFKPKVIGKMFDDLGNYNASQYFYQMQYSKTGDINELFTLVDNAYEEQDIASVRKYVGALISHKSFKSYCQNKNASLAPGDMQTEEYYASWYAELLFLTGDFNNAIKFSKSYVLKNNGDVDMGYTKFNPFRALVNISSELTQTEKLTLKDTIIDLQDIITDSVELSYIEQDLNKLN